MRKLYFIPCLILGLITALGLTWQAHRTYAQCDPTATGGPDTITCEGINGNVSGLGGADTITNNGEIDNIAGNGGNDTITNNGDVLIEMSGGAGNDTIINNGSSGIVFGNGGDDTITNNGEVFVVDSGNGDDTVSNAGEVEIIFTGNGNDIVSNAGDVFTAIDTGDDEDIVVNTGSAENIYTGGGSDAVLNDGRAGYIAGAGGDDLLINTGLVDGCICYPGAIDGGSGNDLIINTGSVIGDGIYGQGGDDDIYSNGTVIGDIAGGNGEDYIIIDGGYVSGDVRGGDDDDLIDVLIGTQIDGIIRGGAGDANFDFDSLMFVYTFEAEDFFIPAEFAEIQATLAALDPNCFPEVCEVTLAVNGLYFTYRIRNMEEIFAFLNFIKITFTPYEEMNCQNGVKCFALKDKAFRNGNVQIYAAEGDQGVAVATVNFRLLGTGGYTYTNPDNGWTVTITYAGTEGDALTYSIVLSRGGDVRNALTTVLAFQYADSAFATHALAWR